MTLSIAASGGLYIFCYRRLSGIAFAVAVTTAGVTWNIVPQALAFFCMRGAAGIRHTSRVHHIIPTACCVKSTIVTVCAFRPPHVTIIYGVGFMFVVILYGCVHGALVRVPVEHDFGAQLLLGYANSQIPSVVLSVMANIAEVTGPLYALFAWVTVSYVMKTFAIRLAERSAPAPWLGFLIFPFCFIEDFIPVVVFASIESLSLEFWLSVCIVGIWEVIRDSPPVKDRLVGLIKHFIGRLRTQRCGCVPGSVLRLCHCPSENGRCCDRGLLWRCLAATGSAILTYFGGSIAAEAVQEAAEESNDYQAARTGQRIDTARLNVLSELVGACLVLVLVVIFYAQQRQQEYSATAVLILLLAECLSTSTATAINVRFIMREKIGLPRLGKSRFCVVNMGIFMAAVVGHLALQNHYTAIQDKLWRCF